MAEFAGRALTKALVSFLDTNMASLEAVHDDFPNPNQKLKYPALTVFQKEPLFTPVMPYVVFKGEIEEPEDPENPVGDENKAVVRSVIGSWDYEFQLDIWAESKPKRALIEKELLAAFSMASVHGISLVLADHYNEVARYDLGKFQYPDGEEASQRSEWRTIVTVTAHVREIKEQKQYLIQTIENTLSTPGEIENVEEDDDSVSII